MVYSTVGKIQVNWQNKTTENMNELKVQNYTNETTKTQTYTKDRKKSEAKPKTNLIHIPHKESIAARAKQHHDSFDAMCCSCLHHLTKKYRNFQFKYKLQ